MFVAKIFDNTLSGWIDLEDEIFSLEKEAFSGEAFTKDTLEADFLDSKNLVVVLKNTTSNEAVGFTYAKPLDPEGDDSPAKQGETAWMWDTVIKKEHRGKGLLGIMMSTLEEELRNRGFKYLERNALIANNFAENIDKHYNDRIIKKFPLDSRWGPQIFFRIRL